MKVAIVGSGIAGLTAAYQLREKAAVTLFEANDYAGGHSNTVDLCLEGVTAPVDTGFLVHNTRTYPQLIQLFNALGVTTHPSEMSLAIRDDARGIEWNGSTPSALLAAPGNFLRPSFWRMLRDIIRFNRDAERLLQETTGGDASLGRLLKQHGYSEAFQQLYLLPMGGAIWSTPARDMLDFPAHTFLRFCHNHGLLQLRDRPRWRTVLGGSREYVARITATLQDVRLSSPVRRITRHEDGVRLSFGDQEKQEQFDAVILACHTDQSLRLLENPSEDERRVLSSIAYAPNRAVLHTDASFLPRRKRLWAAWNYEAGADGRLSVTYLLNKLQPLPFQQPVMVTLNPHREPVQGSLHRAFDYHHPQFDTDAIRAQRDVHKLQGQHNTWYCGAWTRYGFHEDGHISGLAAAAHLLGQLSRSCT